MPIFNVYTIEKQHVEMNIHVKGRTEALNQRDRTSLCRRQGQSRFDVHGRTNAVGAWMRRNGLDQMCGKHPLDNAQDLAHELWVLWLSSLAANN